MRTMEENRLAAGVTVAAVRASLTDSIAYLAEQIKRTEALIRSHIDSHPALRRQRGALHSYYLRFARAPDAAHHAPRDPAKIDDR